MLSPGIGMKLISSTDRAENFCRQFDRLCLLHVLLSLLGLECKVKNKRTIEPKITTQNKSYISTKNVTNWKRKTGRKAEREKQ